MHPLKGRKQSAEHIAKRRAVLYANGTYQKSSERFTKMNRDSIGRVLTDETKNKISEKMKGKKNSLGVKRPLGFREKLSKYWAENKEKHNHYVDGNGHIRGGERRFDMGRLEYRLWRGSVFERDNWKCVLCGTGGDVCADHIKSYRDFPLLRYEITNGRTLCHDCHVKTDNYGGRANKENVA